MKKSISSILKACAAGKTTNDKIALLQQSASDPMLAILKYAFDPSIKFVLPEGAPPYKPCDFLDQEARLYTELRRMYLFIEGGNPNLTKVKREFLFIQLIESIDKGDAELLVAVKDKKLPYKGLTASVVKKAFPNLIPELIDEQNKT
jgi:hypothetical protein